MIKLNTYFPREFFEGEHKNGFYVSSTMKEIWAVELDLIAEFDRVCKKHGIRYMACGGTILGAVRHKGFIPWDDDVDLMMKRTEYNKLCAVASEEFRFPYFFQTEYTDPGSMRGHAQLRNSLTTGVRRIEEKAKYQFNQGIFIDIFPLDNLPDDKEEKKRFLSMIDQKNRKMRTVARFSYRNTEYTRSLSKQPLKTIKKIVCIPARRLGIEEKEYRQYEALLAKYNAIQTKELGVLCVDKLGDRFHYQAKDITPTVDMPFENLIIPIPHNYESVLVKQYGDWKKYVIGTSVHGEILFDTSTPYTKYIE